MCDIGDREAVGSSQRASSIVTRPCTAGQQRRHRGPAGLPGGRPRPDRRGGTRQLPRRRLGDPRAPPGTAPRGKRTALPHRQRRLDRRCRRLRPVGLLHGREARPARVLTLVAAAPCTGAGSTCTRSSLGTSRRRASRSRPFWATASCGASSYNPSVSPARSSTALRRGRSEVVVPWFPYRPAALLYGISPALVARLGDRVVARSKAFRAKAAEQAAGDA